MRQVDRSNPNRLKRAFKSKQPFVIKNSGVNLEGVNIEFLRKHFQITKPTRSTPNARRNHEVGPHA